MELTKNKDIQEGKWDRALKKSQEFDFAAAKCFAM